MGNIVTEDTNLRAAEITEKTAKTNRQAGIFTFTSVLIGAAVTLVQQLNPVSSSEVSQPSVEEVISVESLTRSETIAAKELNVYLSGTIEKDLPSGKVMWVALRESSGEGDSGSADAPYFTVIGLCAIDDRTRKFDCGAIQVGPDDPKLGTYFLYVGLADSSASRALLDITLDQKVNNVYSHPKPGGYETLEPIVVTRK